ATSGVDGVSVGGLVGVGINEAIATVNGGTSAVVDPGAALTSGRDINVTATSAQNTSGEAGANAYSLVVGAARTTAEAPRRHPVTAKVGDPAELTAANDIPITANNSTPRTHSRASNDGGALIGVGLPTATTTIDDSTTARVGARAVVTAT